MIPVPNQPRRQLRRIGTGVEGLDGILGGGLPDLSINIVMGRPGTGKTILTHQALFANLKGGGKALYLTTLAEPSLKIMRYIQDFSFVDFDVIGKDLIYLDVGETIREKGLEETIGRILDEVRTHRPTLVVVDSFKAIHDLTTGNLESRKFGFDLAVQLTAWGATTFLVGEYTQPDIQREPIFSIADSIICLHYETQGLHSVRLLEVCKVRGSDFFGGLHPYVITPEGLKVYSRIKTPASFTADVHVPDRLSSGLEDVDGMLAGGLPGGSATMLAGGAGTGKTLLGLHFLMAAAARGEPAIMVSYQETPTQLTRIAGSFGWDLDDYASRGLLDYMYQSPVEIQPDIHLRQIHDTVGKTRAKLILIDSLKDLEIATPDKMRYKDYVYSMVMGFKSRGVTVIMTNEITELFGPFTLSEYGVSFIADNVLLLRYVEISGRMSRALSVMKMRGSQHSKEIVEFEVTPEGLSLVGPIRAFTGVLTGMPAQGDQGVLNRLPPQPRLVLEVLQRNGQANAEMLARLTGLAPADVNRELEALQLQGLVISVPRKSGDQFKPTF